MIHLPTTVLEYQKLQCDKNNITNNNIDDDYDDDVNNVVDDDVDYIEYRSDDVIKMKFVKLWDLLRYSERTTSKTPTRQKLAIWGKLSQRY